MKCQLLAPKDEEGNKMTQPEVLQAGEKLLGPVFQRQPVIK
jgi:hypothetical protein